MLHLGPGGTVTCPPRLDWSWVFDSPPLPKEVSLAKDERCAKSTGTNINIHNIVTYMPIKQDTSSTLPHRACGFLATDLWLCHMHSCWDRPQVQSERWSPSEHSAVVAPVGTSCQAGQWCRRFVCGVALRPPMESDPGSEGRVHPQLARVDHGVFWWTQRRQRDTQED